MTALILASELNELLHTDYMVQTYMVAQKKQQYYIAKQHGEKKLFDDIITDSI